MPIYTFQFQSNMKRAAFYNRQGSHIPRGGGWTKSRTPISIYTGKYAKPWGKHLKKVIAH